MRVGETGVGEMGVGETGQIIGETGVGEMGVIPTIYEAKTKKLISCTVTAQLICILVFAFSKNWFSYDVAHLIIIERTMI